MSRETQAERTRCAKLADLFVTSTKAEAETATDPAEKRSLEAMVTAGQLIAAAIRGEIGQGAPTN